LKKESDILFSSLTLLTDTLLIEVSFLLSFWLRFHSHLMPITKGIPPLRGYLTGSFFVVFIWLIIFHSFGLYRMRISHSKLEEISLVIKAVSVGTIVVMAATFLYREISYSRIVVLLASFLSLIFLTSSRLLYESLYRWVKRKGVAVKRVAIVGSGEMSKAILKKIEEHPRLGYEVIGIIREGPESENKIDHLPFLGTIDKIFEIAKREKLDSLIMTLPLSSYRKIVDILVDCEELHLDFQLVPDLFELMTSKIRLSEIDGIPLLGLKEFPLEGWNRIFKRTFDLVFSSLALILSAPPMLLSALLIKLTSSGPIFFKQERVGRDGRAFTMYKFRSMREDAEEEVGPIWATENDPRRTKVGKFLRKTSLDELPQLFNVLKGEMSLVGPRPERPVFVKQFKGAIPRYFERHRVKSGITGWAQVNGLRGNTSIEERTKYDLYYVENWSLGFDVKILLKTILGIFSQKNAY